MISEESIFDYIVVGSGSAGAVVASRLAEDPSARVLLLERGGTDAYDIIQHPQAPNIFSSWRDPRMIHDYPTDVYPFGDNRWRPIAWPTIRRGRVRGGCSSVNGMVYNRGNRRDYDTWTALGNRGWSYEDILPFYKKSENFELGANEYHGAGGPLPVRRIHRPSEIAMAFCEAAPALGFAGPDWDFNGAVQEGGAAPFQFSQRADGRRASSIWAFVDSLPEKPNLVQRINALACRIVFEGQRAVGVDCVIDDADHSFRPAVGQSFRAREEIVICGGAIESPKLLMLSGIGPPRHLAQMGVPCKFPLPGVGQNFLDHLLVVMFFESVPGLDASVVTAESSLFTHTTNRPTHLSPDLQFHVSGRLDAITPQAFPYDNFLISPTLVQPHSVGYVELMSADPRHDPHIRTNFLREEQDLRVLLEGVELARAFVHDSPLKSYYRSELKPGGHLSPAELVEHVKETHITVWHPVGTCKMGIDEMSVVDPQLKVYGVDGLRVADASIMPTILAGNINAACVMIGEKAAALMR